MPVLNDAFNRLGRYAGPVTVDVIGSGRVTVQRQHGVYGREAEGARRVNDIAGSQILALVLGGMALERMQREAENLATKGNEA